MSIIGAFVTKFDVVTGNVLLWSCELDPTHKIDFQNVEYLSLPSGIHDNKSGEDVVRFVLKGHHPDTLYSCLSVFYSNTRALVEHSSGSVNRKDVRIYALGIVCTSAETSREDADYIEKYGPSLQKMITVMNKDTPDFTSLASDISKIVPDSSHQSKIPTRLFKQIGPLIFPLWKSCLMNERIILLVEDSSLPFEDLNYLINYLHKISNHSAILSDDEGSPALDRSSTLINAKLLYNIGLFNCSGSNLDVYDPKSNNTGFIAYSGDLILKDMDSLYDKVLCISLKNGIHLYDNKDKKVKSTFLDNARLLEQKGYSNNDNVANKSLFQSTIDFMYMCITMNSVSPPYVKFYNDIPVEPPVEAKTFIKEMNAIHCGLAKLIKDGRKSIKSSDLMKLGLDGFSQQDAKLIQKLYAKVNKEHTSSLHVQWFDINLFI